MMQIVSDLYLIIFFYYLESSGSVKAEMLNLFQTEIVQIWQC